MRLGPDEASIQIAADALIAGRLVGVPTETVYGLAARGDDAAAVASIFAAKGRPASNPLILHVADADAASRLWRPLDAVQSARLERLAGLWPGPLTIVGPKAGGVLDSVTAGGPTVAVRVPDHPVMLRLLGRVRFAVAAPSANPANYVSPTTAQHVADQLGDRVDCILDGGPCRVGLESTVVSLGDRSSPPRLLRIGAIGFEQLQTLFQCVVSTAVADDSVAPSPGMSGRHYSPRVPVRWLDEAAVASPGTLRLYWISATDRDHCHRVSPRGDWPGAAEHLYAVLRRADEAYDAIEIERLPSLESLSSTDRVWVQAIGDRMSRILGP